jgi:hypothetical protein
MRYLIFLLLSSVSCIAQTTTAVLPVAELRTKLLQLIASKPKAFMDIKGTPLNKNGTTQYYNATLHMVPNDTPKIAEDSNPFQVYYMDFLNKGLEEKQSVTMYASWQQLMKEALPDYTVIPDAHYTDLQSVNFTSPNGAIKFSLYRNGDKKKWQVSISVINSNYNELTAAGSAKRRHL